ncbi:MAG: hypothetical protein ACHQM6_00675 [Candidatus Kapaibacterium sp.]
MEKERKNKRLGFRIDKLTSSIENTLTGERFETEIIRLRSTDVSLIKKNDWQFDWRIELMNTNASVYGLVTLENPEIMHGLLSLTDAKDHVEMNLLESAIFNQGSQKLYDGVPGNLVAFACKTSFEIGYDGFVVFDAKTRLIKHYENSLGAKRFVGNRMFIGTREAYKLVTQYFKDFDDAG